MGAPGYTTFCKNGHIVDSVPHHCISNLTVRKCQYCGAIEFTTQMEWGDDDYGPPKIPYKSIRLEWVERNDEFFQGRQKVEVFDVSKVENWSKPTQDETLYCVDCGNMFILEGGEVDFYNRKELHKPRRCKGCRADRRNPGKARKEYERLKKKFEPYNIPTVDLEGSIFGAIVGGGDEFDGM